MAESYFENAELSISAELKDKGFFRTKPYSGPVKLSFMKGSPPKEIDSKTVQASKGSFAAVKWKAKEVEKTEEFYDLQVMCSYKKVNRLLLEAQIWPKEANVEIKDHEDKAKAACPFLIKQAGQPDQTLNTDDKGKSGVTLLARAPYSIAMAKAFEVIEDKQKSPGQFRDHQLKVKDVIKAKFLTPKVDAAPYKDDPDAAPAKIQLVNLTSANPAGAETGGCDAKGNLVVFTVTADPPDTGKKGDKVYFEIEFGKESKRNDPKPELMASLPVLGKAVAGKKTTGYVKLDTDGGKASFEVNLGIAGGDTCNVKIGGTSEVNDAKLKLINWRKIYAQVTKTSAQTAPSLADATTALKKVFIDFEESTADMVTLSEADVPAGAFADGTIIQAGLPAKTLVVGDHNVAEFTKKMKGRFKSEGLPCAHIIYCDEQLDAENAPVEAALDVLGKKTGQAQGKVDFPGGGNVPGVMVPGTVISGSARFFPIDLKDGKDSVKECKWQEVGGTAGDVIAPADYKVDQIAHGDKLFIRLPAAAVLLSDAGKTIKVTVKISYANGWYAGWCTYPDSHVVVKLGGPAKNICQVIVHEVGHAFAQTAESAAEFPGLPAPPHGRYYTNNRGHSGGHCADGIGDAYYKDASKRMDTSEAEGLCTCVMFGAATQKVADTLAFCAKCEPYAKAAKVAAVST